MGTGRKFNKKHLLRPVKTSRERVRRQATQRRRLVALGLDESKVAKMEPFELRSLLKRPGRVAGAS